MPFPEILVSFDTSLFILINSMHTPLLDLFFQGITWFGSGWIVTPVLLLIVVKKTPRKRLKKIVLFGIITISIAGIINSQIKKVVGRQRPVTYFSTAIATYSEGKVHGDTRPYTVRVLGPKLYKKSFPSGHSNTAFAAATFLVLLYGGWFWTSYILAALVAYSRMYMGAHFFVDTIAGALLGTSFVLITWQLFIKAVPTAGVNNDT